MYNAGIIWKIYVFIFCSVSFLSKKVFFLRICTILQLFQCSLIIAWDLLQCLVMLIDSVFSFYLFFFLCFFLSFVVLLLSMLILFGILINSIVICFPFRLPEPCYRQVAIFVIPIVFFNCQLLLSGFTLLYHFIVLCRL